MLILNIKYKSAVILIITFIVIFTFGCSDVSKDNKTIAYISQSKNSDYEKTFNELKIGRIFDYEYKLVNADKTSVQGWLEVYEKGKMTDDNIGGFEYIFRLSEKGEEGNLGFGAIESANGNSSIFFYSPSFTMTPYNIEYDFNKDVGIKSWANAIKEQTLSIEKGQEVILAVYRERKGNELIEYNYQNPDSIEKIIKEDNKVILFKFKIDD